METCTNCGKLISTRHVPEVIDGKIFCEICGPVLRRKMTLPPLSIPPSAQPQTRIYGLSWSESWVVGIIGLLLAPAFIGIPILIWVWLAQRQHNELRRAIKHQQRKHQPTLDNPKNRAH